MPDAPLTAEEYLAAVDKEWSQFVAIEPIYHGNALAAMPGQPVPASNVAQYGYLEKKLVARVTTKAAAAVTSGTTDTTKGA